MQIEFRGFKGRSRIRSLRIDTVELAKFHLQISLILDQSIMQQILVVKTKIVSF